jgi:hypothetical protein
VSTHRIYTLTLLEKLPYLGSTKVIASIPNEISFLVWFRGEFTSKKILDSGSLGARNLLAKNKIFSNSVN